jgi:HopA1 effector protein family
MNSLDLDLAPILEALGSQSEAAFSFQGESYALSSGAEAEAKLSEILYDRCFMRRINRSPSSSAKNRESGLIEDLRAANAARPFWQTGWQVDGVLEGGWISARRDGLGGRFAPGEFITKEGPGMPLRAGSPVDIYFAIASEHMQPGFYFAFGETVADESDNSSLLRFYWHLEATGAPLLLNSVSTLLNRFQVPYRFKCLTHPAAYIRSDSAVLFVPRRWYQIAARLLRDTRRAIASHLRSDSPLFTKPMADGLAFAEDPGGGQSFGMHRCAALARAIRCVALNQGSLSVAEVEAQLSRQGVSPAFPYLNQGSVDIYDFVA